MEREYKSITQLPEILEVSNGDKLLAHHGGRAYQADASLFHGKDATINGATTVEIEAGENVSINQQGGVLTISSDGAVTGVSVNGTAAPVSNKVVTLTIAAGSASGTIAVNGTDVSITGLAAALTALTTLIGNDANKSARAIALEELAAQLIPQDAQAAMDTLQEIAAWIQQHPDDAAAINAKLTLGTHEVDGQQVQYPTVKAYVEAMVTGLITLASISATTTGTGNAITEASYNNTTGAFSFTKGTTFLTQHQDISGKQDKLSATGAANKGVYVSASGVVSAMAHTLNKDVPANAVFTDTTYTPASASPLMDGTAAVGSSAKYAREDHRHPTDTSRASTAVATASASGLLSVQDKWALDAANLDHYDGVDLEARFASEISGYSSVWAWIKARATAKDISGLYVKDYIEWTSTDGKVVRSQIAGINQYLGFNDTQLSAYHIDFISKDLWPEKHVWNKANYNNGMAGNAAPYLASDLKLWLNGEAGAVPNEAKVNPATVDVDYTSTGLLPRLPAALKNVIVKKRALLSQRYSAEGLLTNDTGWAWGSLGKLWVPAEMEVYGCNVWGTKGYSQAAFTQYPIFRDSKMRIKGLGNGGGRATWWLLTPDSETSTYAAYVNLYGNANATNASNESIGAPVCFRIAG